MRISTIGFTGKSAEKFFQLLKESTATKVIDIRINRTSQLAGFAKEQDLRYLLPKLAGMEYQVREDLAPTKELLADYRAKRISWVDFSQKYQEILESQGIVQTLSSEIFDSSVLLCSESEPEMCHRTLLANKLVELFPGTTVTNLI